LEVPRFSFAKKKRLTTFADVERRAGCGGTSEAPDLCSRHYWAGCFGRLCSGVSAKVTREQESLYVLNSQMETWTRRLSSADLREEEIGELKTIHLQGFGHVLPARRQQLELGNHAGL